MYLIFFRDFISIINSPKDPGPSLLLNKEYLFAVLIKLIDKLVSFLEKQKDINKNNIKKIKKYKNKNNWIKNNRILNIKNKYNKKYFSCQ